MMDSQEKTLSQENTEKLNVESAENNMQESCVAAENNAEVTTETTETEEISSDNLDAAELKKVYKTKGEIIERMK